MMKFSLQRLKTLKLFTDVKSHVVLHFDYFEILAARFIQPENIEECTANSYRYVLGGLYIYRQPTIVVFRAGIHRQPLLKFSPCRLLPINIIIFLVAGTSMRDTPVRSYKPEQVKCFGTILPYRSRQFQIITISLLKKAGNS